LGAYAVLAGLFVGLMGGVVGPLAADFPGALEGGQRVLDGVVADTVTDDELMIEMRQRRAVQHVDDALGRANALLLAALLDLGDRVELLVVLFPHPILRALRDVLAGRRCTLTGCL